jgi:hypothetical protein
MDDSSYGAKKLEISRISCVIPDGINVYRRSSLIRVETNSDNRARVTGN